MTAVNENGQVYFTFEELDFAGALVDIQEEIDLFSDENLSLSCDLDKNDNFSLYARNSLRKGKLYEVRSLLRVLLRGGFLS